MCDEIKTLIRETPILRARHGSKLRKINDVVILGRDFMDDEDNPLFDDSMLNPFLSGGYSDACTDLLKVFGLQRMNTNLMISMLRVDLVSAASRMKSDHTSAEWHSKLARLLMRPQKKVVKTSLFSPSEVANGSLLAAWPYICLPQGGFPSHQDWISKSWSRQQLPTKADNYFSHILELLSHQSQMCALRYSDSTVQFPVE